MTVKEEVTAEERKEGLQDADESMTPGRHVPQNQLCKAPTGSQRLKRKSLSLCESAHEFYMHAVVLQLGDFVRHLTMEVGVSLILLPAHGTCFFLLGFLIQP